MKEKRALLGPRYNRRLYFMTLFILPNPIPLQVLEDHSLKAYNTFGIDVNARYFVRARDPLELRNTLFSPAFEDAPRLILGGGSNILLTQDFPGLVIHIELSGRGIVGKDDHATYIEAAAGENWHEFVSWTLAQGVAGLENLSLIPGSVGASPIQNIGAYGVEMQSVFHALTAIDTATGETLQFDHAACRFGYRDSLFKHELKNRVIITSVTFRLPHQAQLHLDYGDLRQELGAMQIHQPTPADVSRAVCNIRRRKLPDPVEIGNAGSFFKNPIVDQATSDQLCAKYPRLPRYNAPNGHQKLSAGWLIEQAGWKGKSVGRAGVHDRHALVLINHGDATGAEVLALATAIQDSVRHQFGVLLEPEPVIV